MIIILEGPDGAGKTTLANYLRDKFGYMIVHRSKPETLEDKLRMYEQYRNSILKGDNLIWDRCWYSEMVYGPVMRDQSYIDLNQMYEYEELLRVRGAVLIHCTDEIELLWKRMQERGEPYIKDIEVLDRLRVNYEFLMHKVPHRIPVLRYELSKNMSFL